MIVLVFSWGFHFINIPQQALTKGITEGLWRALNWHQIVSYSQGFLSKILPLSPYHLMSSTEMNSYWEWGLNLFFNQMGFNQTWVWLQNIFITVKLCCLLSVQSKRELLHRGNSISIHQPTTYIWVSVPTRPVHVLKTQFLCLTPSLTLNCICISTWNRPFFLSTSIGYKHHSSSHSRSPM